MRHQHNRRCCTDCVAQSLLAWCTSGWRDPVAPLAPGADVYADDWKRSFPEAEDGYSSWRLAMQYINSLPEQHRGGWRLEEAPGADWEALVRELQQPPRPVIAPCLLSPVPRIGRVTARLVLALGRPLADLVHWAALAAGRNFHPYREWFLNGEDDVHEHYPHSLLIVGVFQRLRDGAELVLAAEPWGGDWTAFSQRSRVFEVLTRAEFETRWRDWGPLRIPPKIRAKWRRMMAPGSLFVLRK
jgi:hypothetical protein